MSNKPEWESRILGFGTLCNCFHPEEDTCAEERVTEEDAKYSRHVAPCAQQLGPVSASALSPAISSCAST